MENSCIKDGNGLCTQTCFHCLNPSTSQEIDDILGGGGEFRNFVNGQLPTDKAPSYLGDKIKFVINREVGGNPPPNSGDITQN